jgi:hypothetical protein
MRHTVSVFTIALLVVVGFRATSQAPDVTARSPMEIPADRQADSYAIYFQLLPKGQIEGAEWKRSLWLVEDTTLAAVPAGQPCDPGTGALSLGFNPHRAIQPPADREAEFRSLLADFDAHCHESFEFSADQLHTSLPVRLADAATQKRFEAATVAIQKADAAFIDTSARDDEFAGVAAIHTFSEVYFTPDHHLAMVYTSMWCGGQCGMSRWVVLERKDGQWNLLPWVSSFTVS